MLRSQLGSEVFREVVKTYLERHLHGNVVTENLRAVIEETTGQSYDRFFDQYVYHAHHPELDITYSWDNQAKLAKLSIKQIQKVGDRVKLFHVPLPVRFTVDGRKAGHIIQITEKSEDFYFFFKSAPTLVRVDPDLTLLAKIKFKPSNDMLEIQLNVMGDALGRVIAAEKLGERRDGQTVEKLKKSLHCDPFFGVRAAASKALREIGTDEALEALVTSTLQGDARVRIQVVKDIAGFDNPAALVAILDILRTEENPTIRAAALKGIPGHADEDAQGMLLAALDSTSFRHQVADAAIAALKKIDDPRYILELQSALAKDESKYTNQGFGAGLKALAYLARYSEDKLPVLQYIQPYTNHLNKRKRLAAIEALGTLGAPQSIAKLEKIAGTGKDSQASKAATSAINKIRAIRKPEEALKEVNEELLELKKSHEELKKAIEDLKKQANAKGE